MHFKTLLPLVELQFGHNLIRPHSNLWRGFIIRHWRYLPKTNCISPRSNFTTSLIFKCHNELAPKSLRTFICKLEACKRSTRGVSTKNCEIRFCKTSIAQSALLVKGTRLWNSHSPDLKSVTSFSLFKMSWLYQQQC